LMFEQERFSCDLARAARAEEFREGHEQMDRHEEQIAHELKIIMPANLRKTAPQRRFMPKLPIRHPQAAVAAHLRPLLSRTTVAPHDKIAANLAEIEIAFAALVRESREQRPGASAMMGHHLGSLLLHLWRASAGDPTVRGTGTTTVQRFRQLIELHYRDNLSIEVFAKLLGVTRAHLHDACARNARCTPLNLVHDRLLEEARLRLENTEFPVEQIAYGLGFRDPGYFNRFFKRRTGVAPGTYRQTIATARSTNDAPSFAAWP
jgi:AraC family transcriptional activator of pobA